MISFEEKYEKHNASGFLVTNEEPEAHMAILKGRSFRKVAAIASGGEVLLSCLLPRTRDQLIAVDHSYRSITITYLKCLMLKELGPTKTKALMMQRDFKVFKAALDELAKNLPEKLQKFYSGKAPDFAYGMMNDGSYDFVSIRREWGLIPLKSLQESLAKLELLTLVHGDFKDIANKGPFDLLYFSNALEHQGRDKKSPTPADIEPLLKHKAYVILTKTSGSTSDVTKLSSDRAADPNVWTKLEEYDGCRTQWIHQLWQVDKSKAKKAAPEP